MKSNKTVKMYNKVLVPFNCTGKKSGFTLIELLIVITILAILATIAFVSFKNFTQDARDGNRVVTIKNIEKGLELYSLKTNNYPKPNDPKIGSIFGTTIIEKGIIDEQISRILGLSTTPKDPKTKDNYIYSLYNKKQYQIASILESDLVYIPGVSQAYAQNILAKVSGNYKGYIKFHDENCESYINLPSLLWNNDKNKNLLDQDTYYIVDKGNNLPYGVQNLGEIQANDIVKFQRNNSSNATLTKVCREDLEKIAKDEFENTDEENTILASFGVSKEGLASVILGDKSLGEFPSCGNTPHGGKKNFWSVSSVGTNQTCPAPSEYTCDKGFWKEGNETKDISSLFPSCIPADNNCKLTDNGGGILLSDGNPNCFLQ